ncbi:hypothetical protein L3Q82_010307 [Scortum barcoo]|uniref:Uncharacterized protein n=1 Tax=Scortum barcoo TaxID=214431 RepID=A0ACB8WBP4_9TELE|nr:hypothetical protein L3Q82_010307 [Scortum barcoo]
MPQLNGGGGDDLGANDEMISFKDEGEQEEKISENSSAERDLADVKSSLVNESETNQNSSSDSEAERRPPPRSETFRDKTRESLEEAAKRQDGGLFKSPPYPGYPFIMIPDLTSPYLPNGSLSPTARTYLQMKWPLLDVQPGGLQSRQALKDARSPSPAHIVGPFCWEFPGQSDLSLHQFHLSVPKLSLWEVGGGAARAVSSWSGGAETLLWKNLLKRVVLMEAACVVLSVSVLRRALLRALEVRGFNECFMLNLAPALFTAPVWYSASAWYVLFAELNVPTTGCGTKCRERGDDKHTCTHTTHAQEHTRTKWRKEPRQKTKRRRKEPRQKQTKKEEKWRREAAKRSKRASPRRREGRRIWGGQVEAAGGGGGGDGGGGGTEGVMYPRDGASAGPEETGAKAGVLGPGLSLLQQVGCWHLNLSSWSNKVPVVQHPHHVHPLTPLITYSNEHFTPGNPPPHLQTDVDPKTGIPRPPHPPDISPYYPLSPGTVGQIPHPLGWFPPHMVPPHHSLHTTGIPHPAIVTPNVKQESSHSDISSLNSTKQSDAKKEEEKKKQVHIKKPLNAFMLYMKEMRAKVVAECTLKESAAINQILGRRWHALSREEQAKYYELARKERQLHMQLYPGWSARDNYGKRKKRKREKQQAESNEHREYFPNPCLSLPPITDANTPKKCRALFGLDQLSLWCKPCRLIPSCSSA